MRVLHETRPQAWDGSRSCSEERGLLEMRRKIAAVAVTAVLASLLFSGCSGEERKALPEILKTETQEGSYFKELKAVTQVGEVPQQLRAVVENNIFYHVTAFEDRILKVETLKNSDDTKTYQVHLLDCCGKELAAYQCTTGDAYWPEALTATSDGGFLFVLGFSDRQYPDGAWASDDGFASRVVKCDKKGKVQFDTPFDSVEGEALKFCFEKNGKFYFFGTRQTPGTKQRGVHSPTDVYMTILDEKGTVCATKTLQGSDYDNLESAQVTKDGFLLSVWAQSDDGDFAGSNSGGYPVDWVVTVNDDLEVISRKKETGRNAYLDAQIGVHNGNPVYQSNALLEGFDAGSPRAFVDYGDYFLIVSENATGVYGNTPSAIDIILYNWETVYSGYDYDGNLLFRAAVDSTPSYYNEVN